MITDTTFMFFATVTTIDRPNRKLTCVTRNESFLNLGEVKEITTFEPHPDDPHQTRLTLDTECELSSRIPMRSSVEKLALSLYFKNINKAREYEKTMIRDLMTAGEPGLTYIEKETFKRSAEVDEYQEDKQDFASQIQLHPNFDNLGLDLKEKKHTKQNRMGEPCDGNTTDSSIRSKKRNRSLFDYGGDVADTEHDDDDDVSFFDTADVDVGCFTMSSHSKKRSEVPPGLN